MNLDGRRRFDAASVVSKQWMRYKSGKNIR